MAKILEDLATAVYTTPGLNRQSPDSEALTMKMDCETRTRKNAMGAQYFNSQDEIKAGLAEFKTFNGTPLIDLLGKYGVVITYAEGAPSEAYGPGYDDQKGDMLPRRCAPCCDTSI
jgi:hypothetical protein